MAARHASELELMRFDDDFEGIIRLNEPMARHTTYRIGGPARAFVEVNSIAALGAILKVCADEQLPWFITGKGSNLLVSDEGYDGVVITLAGDFRAWRSAACSSRHRNHAFSSRARSISPWIFWYGICGRYSWHRGRRFSSKCGHPKRLDGFSRGVCYGIQCTNGTKTLRSKRLDVGVSQLLIFTK